MTRGQPFSDDLRQVLIYMGTRSSFSDVIARTGVSKTTLRRLYNEYERNGHILRPKPTVETRGRKSKLTAGNVNVCLVTVEVSATLISIKFIIGNIRQRNDLYLNELHEMLSNRIGVSVDDSTIWKALHKKGFTMKKVRSAQLLCH